MVFIDLQVTFETENIEEIFIQDESFSWCFFIICAKCHEKHPKEIYFSETENHDISGSKGTANFIMNCKNCKNELNINVHPTSRKRI